MLTLFCDVDGIPKPTVTWSRNGAELEYTKDIYVTANNTLKLVRHDFLSPNYSSYISMSQILNQDNLQLNQLGKYIACMDKIFAFDGQPAPDILQPKTYEDVNNEIYLLMLNDLLLIITLYMYLSCTKPISIDLIRSIKVFHQGEINSNKVYQCSMKYVLWFKPLKIITRQTFYTEISTLIIIII